MSQPLSSNPPLPPLIEYAPKPPKISLLAVTAFLAGIAGLLTCFTFIVPLIALLLGLVAANLIQHNPAKRAGLGFANTGALLGFVGILLCVLFYIFVPTTHRSGCGGHRPYCAANLRGILQSMNIYAADNADKFPAVAYAPYNPSLNNPASTPQTSSAATTLNTYYATPPNQAGSPIASLWILVLNSQASPKQFICPADPFASRAAAARITNPAGNYYDNFQSGSHLSYSVAYPWYSDGTLAPWWSSTTDSSLPLMADIAPESGTGTPPRILNPSTTPRDPRTWNSANHESTGQNVGFSDAHAEFVRSPDIGQSKDNIYSTSAFPSTGPTQFNGIPTGKFAPQIPPTKKSPPFDIMLLPVRNATTGAM